MPCPLIVLASSKDKIWPWGLADRWEDVAAPSSNGNAYRMIELGKISHFHLMVSDEAIKAANQTLAAAARAATAAM